MKEKLKGPKVEDVFVAVVQEVGENNEKIYNVYLINQKTEALEQVMVSSKGYLRDEQNADEVIETNMLRKLLGNIEASSFQMVEPIMEDVFHLNNEYWVSFWIGSQLYDKKFIFLAETIQEENFVTIPLLQKTGVLVGN